MTDTDPVPPWERPAVVGPAKVKSARGRGASPVKPLSAAALRVMAEKRAAAKTIEPSITDCQGCGFWVLSWPSDISSHVYQVDIWVIPYADAAVLWRYGGYAGGKGLWTTDTGRYRGTFSEWDPYSPEQKGALITHACGYRWWLYRPAAEYLAEMREQNARRGN